MNFTIEPSTTIFLNTTLGTLMCPLQITNDIEPLSLTLHVINRHLIHQLPNVKNYLIDHNSDTNNKFKNKKTESGEHIFTPLYQLMTQNSKYKWL